MRYFIFYTEGVRRYPVRVSETLWKDIRNPTSTAALRTLHHQRSTSLRHPPFPHHKVFFPTAGCNKPFASQTGVLVCKCSISDFESVVEVGGSGVPRGVGGSTPPPKSRRPSKIVPNSTRLRKLLKIAEFMTPTPQDVRKKRQ